MRMLRAVIATLVCAAVAWATPLSDAIQSLASAVDARVATIRLKGRPVFFLHFVWNRLS